MPTGDLRRARAAPGPAARARFAGRLRRSQRQLPLLVADALRELRADWRMNALALLGLAWGGAAVVLLMGFGAGFSRFLDLGFEKTGDRYVTVRGEYATRESGGTRPGREIAFGRRDVARVRAATPSASAVAGGVLDAFAAVRSARRTRTTVVKAASPPVAEIWAQRVAQGRFFDEADERAGRAVAVLGANLARVFFGDQDPLGAAIEIEGRPFRVVGVLARKGFQMLVFGGLDDDTLFVPLRAGQAALGRGDGIDALYVDPAAPDLEEQVVREVAMALAREHHIAPGDERALRFESISSYAAPVRRVGRALELLLGFVGAATLALGGIGLSGAMSAIVKQRTVEIGARRACGARRGDIALQLAVEGLVTVGAGGVCGIAVSTLACAGIAWLPLPEELPTPRLLPRVVGGAFGLLALTGVLAGIPPARRACRVDPGVALRAS